MRTLRALRALAAPALAIAALAACSSGTAPEPTASTAPAPSASPSPSSEPSEPPAAYEPPGEVAGGIARADFSIVDGVPTNASTALGPLVAGQTFVVEGQCIGGERMDFLLERAIDAEPDARTLMEGTFECGDDPDQGFSYSLPYDGVVQLTIAPDADVTEAWAVVRSI